MVKTLIDTNLLVYMYDLAEPEKRQRAVTVLQHVRAVESGVLSAQVLSEFFNTVTAGIPLDHSPSRRPTASIGAHLANLSGYLAGCIRGSARGKRISIQLLGCPDLGRGALGSIPVVLSEDFNAGAVIEGVRFVNPFEQDFELAALGGDDE